MSQSVVGRVSRPTKDCYSFHNNNLKCILIHPAATFLILILSSLLLLLSPSQSSIPFTRLWHKVDASDRILGKLSVSIATALMGKNKPIYDQSQDLGDYVVVTNARKVVVTGKKEEQKLYYRHTMYPGGLKTESLGQKREKKPEEIIRLAVSGMLPKNKLRERRLERLKIFADDDHPYEQNILKRYDLGDAFTIPGNQKQT